MGRIGVRAPSGDSRALGNAPGGSSRVSGVRAGRAPGPPLRTRPPPRLVPGCPAGSGSFQRESPYSGGHKPPQHMWRSFGGISDSSPLNYVEFARRTPVHIPRRKAGLYPETFNPRMTEKPPRPIKLTRADLTPGRQAVGPPCAPAESRPGRCFRNDQRARGAATTASASRPRV